MATWLAAVGAVMVVVVLYGVLFHYVLDISAPPPGDRPARRDGSPA